MDINMIEVGKRITKVRNELGLSREKFGNQIGVKNSVIYNLEVSRNKTLNEPILIAICTKYGINKDWLLYGKGEKYTKTKDTLIDELANKYNLGFYGKQIIRTYIDLPDDKKAIIDDFVKKLVENCNVDTTLAAARGNAEIEIIADDEAVRKDIANYVPPTKL